ncbi:metalloreductase STEAP3 isoform X2 [Clupea harengus]|nr:metalloreductase STEAP3 isoform X2 [Clupea harengus]XP_031414195.1 metalloreductase STEAP3 isoform X2 [Clupea harengus]
MSQGDMKQPLLRSPRRPQGSLSDPGTDAPLVGILGTGDFSRSLAQRLLASGYRVVVGSRCPKRSSGLFPEEADVTTQQEAASQADLVFVGMFVEHYSTLSGLKEILAGKILVDVSNGMRINHDEPSNAEQLAALFPDSVVVKGFNVISAWTLQTGPRDGSRQVQLCGDNAVAKNSVAQLCRDMGFIPVDLGRLSSARDIENSPLRLFPTWTTPVLCALSLFLFFYLFNFLHDVLHPYITSGRNVFYKLPIDTVNVTLPAVAMVMLALVYLPGLLAAFLQLWRGTKYRRFPEWLDRWLQARKQMGLLAFLCAALHAVYSLCLPMRRSARYKMLDAAFRQVKEGRAVSWVEEEVWRMELYVSAGILALGLLSLLAVASLPSVGNSLNWREFTFIQSRLGYTALLMSTLHTLLFGWDRAFQPSQYHFYLPPTFMLALTLPCAVLLCRLALALPCVARRLARIRRGWERQRCIRFQLPEEERNGVEDISNV